MSTILIRTKWWQALLAVIVLEIVLLAIGYFYSPWLFPVGWIAVGLLADFAIAWSEHKLGCLKTKTAERVSTVLVWPVVVTLTPNTLRDKIAYAAQLWQDG